MTDIKKILEKFDKEFVKDCGPDIEPIFIYADGSVGPIRQFLTTSIQQAVAEERERVRKEIEFVKTNIAWCRTKGIDADSGDDARQIGWDGACDLILSSISKPLTDKE